MHAAIEEARQIICLTGWSLWVKLQLLRGQDAAVDNRTIGQMLVDKAESGVEVIIFFEK